MNQVFKLEIDKVVEKYRESALDKTVYDGLMPVLYETIEQRGCAHYDTAIVINQITDQSSCDRGMYKDLLLLINPDISDGDKSNVTRHVRANRKVPITTEVYESRKLAMETEVACYATMEHFYHRSRTAREGALIDHLLTLGRVSEAQLMTIVSENPDTYMLSKYWDEYRFGNVIRYGWLVTTDTLEDGQNYYTVIPIGWDGINVPDGKLDYKQYKENGGK